MFYSNWDKKVTLVLLIDVKEYWMCTGNFTACQQNIWIWSKFVLFAKLCLRNQPSINQLHPASIRGRADLLRYLRGIPIETGIRLHGLSFFKSKCFRGGPFVMGIFLSLFPWTFWHVLHFLITIVRRKFRFQTFKPEPDWNLTKKVWKSVGYIRRKIHAISFICKSAPF